MSSSSSSSSSRLWSRKTPPVDGKSVLISGKFSFADTMDVILQRSSTPDEMIRGVRGSAQISNSSSSSRPEIPKISSTTSKVPSPIKQPRNEQRRENNIVNSSISAFRHSPDRNNVVVFSPLASNHSMLFSQNNGKNGERHLISTQVAKGTFRRVANTNAASFVPTKSKLTTENYSNNKRDLSESEALLSRHSMTDQLLQLRPSQIKKFVDGWIAQPDNPQQLQRQVAVEKTVAGYSRNNVHDVSSVGFLSPILNSRRREEEEDDGDLREDPIILSGDGKNYQITSDDNDKEMKNGETRRKLSSFLVSQERVMKEADEVEKILLERRNQLIGR